MLRKNVFLAWLLRIKLLSGLIWTLQSITKLTGRRGWGLKVWELVSYMFNHARTQQNRTIVLRGGGGGGGGGGFKIALAVRFHHYQLLSSDALLSPWQWCLWATCFQGQNSIFKYYKIVILTETLFLPYRWCNMGHGSRGLLPIDASRHRTKILHEHSIVLIYFLCDYFIRLDLLSGRLATFTVSSDRMLNVHWSTLFA